MPFRFEEHFNAQEFLSLFDGQYSYGSAHSDTDLFFLPRMDVDLRYYNRNTDSKIEAFFRKLSPAAREEMLESVPMLFANSDVEYRMYMLSHLKSYDDFFSGDYSIPLAFIQQGIKDRSLRVKMKALLEFSYLPYFVDWDNAIQVQQVLGWIRPCINGKDMRVIDQAIWWWDALYEGFNLAPGMDAAKIKKIAFDFARSLLESPKPVENAVALLVMDTQVPNSEAVLKVKAFLQPDQPLILRQLASRILLRRSASESWGGTSGTVWTRLKIKAYFDSDPIVKNNALGSFTESHQVVGSIIWDALSASDLPNQRRAAHWESLQPIHDVDYMLKAWSTGDKYVQGWVLKAFETGMIPFKSAEDRTRIYKMLFEGITSNLHRVAAAKAYLQFKYSGRLGQQNKELLESYIQRLGRFDYLSATISDEDQQWLNKITASIHQELLAQIAPTSESLNACRPVYQRLFLLPPRKDK